MHNGDWNIWWTLAIFMAWVVLPASLIGAKLYQERQWEKKFGEKKPR